MLTTYGTRPEHFNAAYPFMHSPAPRVGFKMSRWSKTLMDGAAVFAGLALLTPCILVLLSPLIAATMN